MVRLTAKRKSEGAVPPAKQRKTSRSPSPEPETHSSDGPFVEDLPVTAKHVRKPLRKPAPARKTKADDEYDEEDVGRMESQMFLAVLEFESMKKLNKKTNNGYMDKYEKDVTRTKRELKLAMSVGEQELSKHECQFLESFRAAYSASRSQDSAQGNVASSSPTQGFAALYKKSKDLTSTAFALVAMFEEVAQRISNLDTTALIENEWEEQDIVLATLLMGGKRVGIMKYTRMLTASREKVLGGEDKDTDDLLFEEDKIDSVWGKIVRKQEKALKKQIKAIETGK